MASAMNRLLWWHWLLIGAGASLILFLILYFAVIRPKINDATTVQGEADGIENAGGKPEKVAQQVTELKKAKAETIRIQQDWAKESPTYMPTIEFDKDPLRAYEAIQNTGTYRIG